MRYRREYVRLMYYVREQNSGEGEGGGGARHAISAGEVPPPAP